MKNLKGFAHFLLVFLMLGAVSGALTARADTIESIRFGAHQDKTRIVIETDGPLDYSFFHLSEDGLKLVIDFGPLVWKVGTNPTGDGAGLGVIDRYRYSNSANGTRLVFDLTDPAQIVRRLDLPPTRQAVNHRIVLDVEAVGADKFARLSGAVFSRDGKRLGDLGATPPPSQVKGRAPARSKPIIVIDPGHGGKDPGAIGRAGVREKDVNLAAALELKDALEATGRFEVALTRSTDVFITLPERVRRARDFKADLFISIHADAGPNATTRGAAVYTLSDDGRVRTFRERQNQDWVLDVEDENRPADVNTVLVDLVVRDTGNQSAVFAQNLIPELKAEGAVLSRTHRQDNFYVLLAPDVPAVLLEMGFLTNAEDERLLATAKGRKAVVTAVTRAVVNYFDAEERLLAQQ
jgi:N-acetylmuramoyl-L-alanine amidase